MKSARQTDRERRPDSQTQRHKRTPDREIGRDKEQTHRNKKKGRETERRAVREESGKLGEPKALTSWGPEHVSPATE